jgi:RNA polymerase sigma-70 factor (ECF subfamily)
MLGSQGDLHRDGTTTRASAEDEEARLIARVCAGDREAFEALYRLYHPRLARFLDRMTRHPALVDELLNDTMLVVWRRAASFNGRSKVSTWVFGIAYRKALKALRQLDDAVEDDRTEEPAESEDAEPEHQFGRLQLHALLQRALQGLSAEHRAVVDLTYFHGMGYREIAEVVDCPVDTVKTRMFHARRRLRLLLGGRLEEWL